MDYLVELYIANVVMWTIAWECYFQREGHRPFKELGLVVTFGVIWPASALVLVTTVLASRRKQ